MTNQNRSQVTQYFIEGGKEFFSHVLKNSDMVDSLDISRDAITRWLWRASLEAGTLLTELEINEIISKVHAISNQVGYPNNTLTVEGLRKKLAKLPDNMPVKYERIEDSYFEKSWHTENLVTEKNKPKPDLIKWIHDNPDANMKIEKIDGVVFAVTYGKYIAAHNAMVTTNESGEKVFSITAHY